MSDEEEFIESHIRYIRRMASLDDNQIRALLRIKIAENSSIVEKFKDIKMKKQLDEIKLMAKDIKTQPDKIARRVAWQREIQMNKTDTQKCYFYDEYIKQMSSCKGYIRNEICLDEKNKRIVTLSSLYKGCTGAVIDIRCPSGYKISVMGSHNVPRGVNTNVAHTFQLRLSDSTDNIINQFTKIRITREKITGVVTSLSKIYYSDISSKTEESKLYRFAQTFELRNEDHLIVYAMNPDIDIDANNTKFAFNMDMWEFN